MTTFTGWDVSYLTNPEKLQAFVKEFYETDGDDSPILDATRDAIKANAFAALEVLWEGPSFYDISRPCYHDDLLTAVEIGSIAMVKMCYDAFTGRYDVNDHGPIGRRQLEELAGKNPNREVLLFVTGLPRKIYGFDPFLTITAGLMNPDG